MKKFFLLVLLCGSFQLVSNAQSSLGALRQYIENSNAQYDAAITYRRGIEKYYGE